MKTKILYNGKNINNRYKWEKFKYQVRVFVRRLVVGSLVASTLMGVGYLSHGDVVAYERVDTLGLKVDQLKGELLDQLKTCESGNGAVITFDSNSKASIGSYQFQIATVQHYKKLLDGETLTNKEAVYLALDDESARQLASQIIFQSKDGLDNWYNCSVKHGLYGQLQVINKLK